MEQKYYRKHPVQNVDTGEIYESVTAASKELRCLPQHLMRAIREGRRCRGHLWKYLDRKLVVREQPKYDWNNKVVIELKSKMKFASILQAAEVVGLSLAQMLRAIHKHQIVNGMCFALESEYKQHGDGLLEKFDRQITFKHSVREIICFETGEHYETASACANKLGVSRQCVNSAVKRHSTVRGYHFYRADENPELLDFAGPSCGRKPKAVVNLKSKQVWKCLDDCAKDLGITKASAFYALQKGRRFKDGSFLVYFDDWMKQTTEEKNK